MTIEIGRSKRFVPVVAMVALFVCSASSSYAVVKGEMNDRNIKKVNDALTRISSGQDDEDYRLIDISDEELENEIRRRHIGGPNSPEETISLLNKAIDRLHSREVTRNRKFCTEADSLLELLTGENEPAIELIGDDGRRMREDPDYLDEPMVERGHQISRSTMEKIVNSIEGANGEPRRTHSGVQQLYRWYHPALYKRFKARLQVPNRRTKLQSIDEHTIGLFRQARSRLQPVHGRMLQRWARQRSRKISLDEFVASSHWLHNFKRRHGIVSRKVTLYVSKSEQNRQASLGEVILNFTKALGEEIRNFDADHIWNFDQVGFNYEPANKRTLSFRGERDTSLLIGSSHKHTHSYTAQPMISRSGKLFPKLLLVMKETSPTWGPLVEKKIEDLERRYGNIDVFPSTSGKLTSALMRRWMDGSFTHKGTTWAVTRRIEQNIHCSIQLDK